MDSNAFKVGKIIVYRADISAFQLQTHYRPCMRNINGKSDVELRTSFAGF